MRDETPDPAIASLAVLAANFVAALEPVEGSADRQAAEVIANGIA